MARQGKLVLPSLARVYFVPVDIEASAPAAQSLPARSFSMIDAIKGDVTIRLDAATMFRRFMRLWITHQPAFSSKPVIM